MINPNGRVGMFKEDIQEIVADGSDKFEEAIQRRAAISNLAKSLVVIGEVARGEKLDVAQEQALTKQLYRLGEGLRFYKNLGIIDQKVHNQVIRVSDGISKGFYGKYNAAKIPR